MKNKQFFESTISNQYIELDSSMSACSRLTFIISKIVKIIIFLASSDQQINFLTGSSIAMIMKYILQKKGVKGKKRSVGNIMKKRTVSSIIEKKKKKMTKSQIKLSEFILENIDEVGFLTYSQISRMSSVSEASFIRFLRFLGFNGFSDFKDLLKENLKNKVSPSIRMKETITKIENKEDLFKNLIKIDRAMLDEVEENWSEKKIEKAVLKIKEARNIYIAGFGISRGVVDFLDFRFNRLGYPSVPVVIGGAEVVEKLYSADKSDVIIVVGFFRPHKEMSIIYRIADEKKIPVIALTDSFSSPLKEGADIVLHARRGPKEFITSLAAPMTVANILTMILALEDENKAIDSFSKLESLKDEFDL